MSFTDKVIKRIKSRSVIEEFFGIIIGKLGYGNKYMYGKNAMYKTYTLIRKKYKKLIGNSNLPTYDCENMQNTIWFCWLQGMEEAPELVKNCYDSIIYHKGKMNLILINKDNFQEYADLPQFVIDKWKKGIISNTHFSDVLRINLLLRHGGLWMDSTTYLTGDIPKYITDGDFFVYQDGFFNNDMINFGSWLIYSKPNNILLKELQNLLLEYWKRCNYLKNYFILNMFFRMVTDYYPEEWKKVPYYNQIDQHIFQWEFLNEYDEKRYEQIKNISPVHKLSNKFNKNQIQNCSYYSKLSSLYKN